MGYLKTFLIPKVTQEHVSKVNIVDKLITIRGPYRTWNTALLMFLRPVEVVSKITLIPLGGLDIRYWKSELVGTYNFKAIFKEIQGVSCWP